MTDYDVFNGDADGICSLIQLRLSDPRDAELVTGVKRDIALLDRVDAKQSDRITVLDVSIDRNLGALTRNLEAGASIDYFDHHGTLDAPSHPNMSAYLNRARAVCTAAIVNDYLGGAHRAWAVVGAYGDNFPALAQRIEPSLPHAELKTLGEMINYNAYGEDLDDLMFHPADLYRRLSKYNTPMGFLLAEPGPLLELEAQFRSDLEQADVDIQTVSETAEIRLLPDSAASRRISGMLGNRLAQAHPDRAYLIATQTKQGYRISMRAPLSRRAGAGELARQFGGGGRPAAAGIDNLPCHRFDDLVKAFRDAFTD